MTTANQWWDQDSMCKTNTKTPNSNLHTSRQCKTLWPEMIQWRQVVIHYKFCEAENYLLSFIHSQEFIWICEILIIISLLLIFIAYLYCNCVLMCVFVTFLINTTQNNNTSSSDCFLVLHSCFCIYFDSLLRYDGEIKLKITSISILLFVKQNKYNSIVILENLRQNLPLISSHTFESMTTTNFDYIDMPIFTQILSKKPNWIEQGLASHQTHYRSYRGRVL